MPHTSRLPCCMLSVASPLAAAQICESSYWSGGSAADSAGAGFRAGLSLARGDGQVGERGSRPHAVPAQTTLLHAVIVAHTPLGSFFSHASGLTRG